MTLNHDLVGRQVASSVHSWDSTDALLYAIGVGAGLGDPLLELQFTTENSIGIPQQVLPTFGVLVGQTTGIPDLGDFNPAMLVHADQYVELHAPLPVAGSVRTTSRVTGIYDKGSGALVSLENIATDEHNHAPLVTARMSMFVRGEGGFGGDRGTDGHWDLPDREPDFETELQTRPEQGLLYRLSGDRNPLHSDPAFAARGGFERPILHGLCAYGFAGRALLCQHCDSQPARFRTMYGRFSRPVMPGDTLVVSSWAVGAGTALFRVTVPGTGIVIDRGRLTFSPD